MPRGGYREGAGRKPLVEEVKVLQMKERLAKMMADEIADEEAIKILASFVKKGNLKALQIWFEYRWGKPSQKIDANITNDIGKVIIERKIIDTSVEN